MCCPSFLQISSFPDYLPQRRGNPGDVPEAHEKPSPCLSPSPEDAGLLCYMWDTGVAYKKPITFVETDASALKK